jgi:MoaA/NifB/PqqE/SkfB family radical SAM enzyme
LFGSGFIDLSLIIVPVVRLFLFWALRARKNECMAAPAPKSAVIRSVLANARILRAGLSVSWFLLRYLGKFNVLQCGGRLIVHSHLPPLNSKAFSRFIDEHLLAESPGPSHAQIGITDACPQNCGYCYNRGREGVVMDTETILAVIRELKSMGVFWIGLTGGEPLMNRDIVRIVEAIGDDCCAKLFTTGSNLTERLAADLKRAGLLYVTVSLDHWEEAKHDQIRGHKGAFRTALRALEIFRKLGEMHVGVSSVLSEDMLRTDRVEEFLAYLQRLEVDEAWLSEAKPSAQACWKKEMVVTEQERQDLIRLQDRWNKRGGLTVNYLGHFEDRRHFGCTAGQKMVFVDPFGEVSPCVFIPMTFGNVREGSLRTLYGGMRSRFPAQDHCFINANYMRFLDHDGRKLPFGREESLSILNKARFGPLPRFFRLQHRQGGPRRPQHDGQYTGDL